jgi:hypothetical protein
MRARAFVKYPTLATHAALLCSDKLAGNKWYSETKRALQRLGISIPDDANPSKIATATAEAAEKQLWTAVLAQHTKNWCARFWYRMGFGETTDYLRHYNNRVAERLDGGITMLISARCGGLWTGATAAKRGLIPQQYLTACPH